MLGGIGMALEISKLSIAERASLEALSDDVLALRPAEERDELEQVHVIGEGIICETEDVGSITPHGLSPLEIVLDASEGFVPLWMPETTLRWRFRESSLARFQNPHALRAKIEQLFGEALLLWGDAAPIKFAQRDDAWDFEIVMRDLDSCNARGCVLASAFFPDAGRHELFIYPKMFTQVRREQVETLAHEIGHIFGLRHFFAQISESRWASVVFGEHSKFSIMNYGADSSLTDADKADLKLLYKLVWSGELTEINGTPIRLVRAYHDSGVPASERLLSAA